MSTKKKIIIGVVVFTVIIATIGAANTKDTTNSTTQTSEKQTTAPTTAKQEAPQITKPEYTEAFHEVNARVENFEVVINAGADGKTVADYLKTTCNKPCNIYIFDDAKAQKLDREYATLGMSENSSKDGKVILAEMDTWKKTNYVYVADHLIGSVDFETGEWDDYPYRDSQYRELGGKN